MVSGQTGARIYHTQTGPKKQMFSAHQCLLIAATETTDLSLNLDGRRHSKLEGGSHPSKRRARKLFDCVEDNRGSRHTITLEAQRAFKSQSNFLHPPSRVKSYVRLRLRRGCLSHCLPEFVPAAPAEVRSSRDRSAPVKRRDRG